MNLFKKILPKDSFYLVLFVCVGVLGASAMWVSKGNINSLEQEEAKKETAKAQLVEEEIKLDLREENVKIKPKEKKEKVITKEKLDTKKTIVQNEVKPESKAEPKIEAKVEAKVEPKVEKKPEQQPETKSEAVASAQVKVENIKLKKPVEGRIYKDFANDKLVYSKTLEEWSVHLGIDIAAKEGTNVKAAYDGIVKNVEKDGKLGITITLDHGNGLETVYKNISTGDMVKIGQKVKIGDVISKVSKGIGFEKLDEPHLHFEVLESGTRVDPKGFF